MWSLADTLAALDGPLAELIPEATGAGLRRVAARLPAAITRRFYLERWLTGDPRADLIVKVDRHSRLALAAELPACVDSGLGHAVAWRGIATFVRAWSATSVPWANAVDGIWLEFDEETSADGRAQPRVFVDFRADLRRAPALEMRYRWAAAALQALSPGTVGAAALAGLRRCLEALPPRAALPYVGLALRAEVPEIRVCVSGLGSSLLAYLAAIGWPGDRAELQRDVLDRLADRGSVGDGPWVLHLDLGDAVGVRIGLEYAFPRLGQAAGLLSGAALLDEVVARGWCDPGVRDGLSRWPGRSVELLASDIWFSHVTRQLSHLKIVHAPGEPVEVKAYLCVALAPWAGGAVVGRRLRKLGNGGIAPSHGVLPLFALINADHVSRQVAGNTVVRRPVGHGTRLAPENSGFLGGTTMTMSNAQQQALEKILTRASVDAGFRTQLLSEPHKAIFEGFGVRVAPTFRLKFIEKASDVDALVVLPDIERAGGELTDGQLEVVAGGGGGEAPDDPEW